MATNTIPDKVIDMAVFLDDTLLLGVADAELPDLESLSETLAGSGIMGEIDMPTLGQFGSLGLKLNFRRTNANYIKLMKPVAHNLTLRAATQDYDGANGKLIVGGYKLVVQGLTKKSGLGKLESAKPQDNEKEIECTYLKLVLSDQDMFELDKINYILKIEGTDYLQEVRRYLGRET